MEEHLSLTSNQFPDLYNWDSDLSNFQERHHKAAADGEATDDRNSGKPGCVLTNTDHPKRKLSIQCSTEGDNIERKSSDCGDKAGMDSDHSECNLGSKNLVSERKRREKMREKLLALRALVPNITKMDKTSILVDAISYVQSLQNQIEEVETGISLLESTRPKNNNAINMVLSNNTTGCGALNSFGQGGIKSSDNAAKQIFKILDLNVIKVGENTYLIRISCKKEEGIIVQLSSALESLQLSVINAHLAAFDVHIISSVFVEVEKWEAMQENEIKQKIIDAAFKYGFQLV